MWPITSPGTNLSDSVPSFSSLTFFLLGLKVDSTIDGLSTGLSGDAARDSKLGKCQIWQESQ
jgi:hypothetical protein